MGRRGQKGVGKRRTILQLDDDGGSKDAIYGYGKVKNPSNRQCV